MDEIELGTYKHFKGGEVEVLHVATHSETLEQYVAYKTLYENRTHGKGSIWVRPLAMFFEQMSVNETTIPRFVLKK